MLESLIVFLLAGSSLVLAEVNLIDLTHTFGHRTVYWPGNPAFNFTRAFALPMNEKEGVVVVANYFQTAEHSGTHMDAPKHFCTAGKYVHQVSMEKLSGPGVVLDFTDEADRDRDFEVTLQHVQVWEEDHGRIPDGAIVIMKFGWGLLWPDLNKIWGSDDIQDHQSFHYPGMSSEASDWLARERKIHALGTDTPSPDASINNAKFPVHVNLLCKHGVIILENVGNIESLPVTGSQVYIGALKLENGSGTPVRLFAVVGSGCGTIEHFKIYFWLIIISMVNLVFW